MDVKFPNIRHLRVFLEVAKTHSISVAAGQIHLSQPAVTQAISKLEADLDVTLFHRKNVGFHATEIGEKFIIRVERALLQLKQGAKQSYKIGKGARSGEVANFDKLTTSAQLRALVAVGESRSYSVAGRNIGLSQPSVHRSVANLETLSELTLFQNISSGIEPTAAGSALIKHTKLAFSEIQQGFNEIAEFRGNDTTTIVVGSLPLARTYILPLVAHEMIENTKEVQIRVVDGPYNELLRGLRSGEIDFLIGALRDPSPADDVVQEALFSDPLVIVAGCDHPLAKNKKVSLADISKYPWAAPPKTTPGGGISL